jgi:O-antigen/teichoic acid export membrane protein
VAVRPTLTLRIAVAPSDRPSDVLDRPEAGGLVVRGGIVRILGFGLGMLLSLLGVVLLTRHLGPAVFGRYQVVVSLVTVVGVLTDLGMANLGIREYAQRHGEDRERLMRVLLGMRLSLTVLGVVGAAGFALAAGYPSEMVAGVLLMGVGLLFLVVQTTLQIPLNATLRLPAVAAIDVGRQGLQAVLIAALVVAGASLLPFLAVTIPVHAVLVLWTAALVGSAVPLRPMFSLRAWLELARPALAFSLAVAVGIVYVYTAQILMSLVATERETGLFSAAFRVFVILAGVPALLVSGALPLLSRAAQDDDARLANIVRGLYAGMLVLGGAAAVACVVGAEPIIDVVAGPGYEPAADVLRIQGAALLASFVVAAWGFTLLARHQHAGMVYANLAAFVISATTVIILSGPLGEVGAALGTLLGEVVLLAGYLWALSAGRRELRPELRDTGRVALALAAAGAAALVPLPPVARTALALAAYGLVAYYAGAVPDDLMAQLPNRLRRGRRP